MHVVEYAAIALGVVALVGVIAFLSHRSGSAQPAGSGTVAAARLRSPQPGAGSPLAATRCGRLTQLTPLGE